MAGILDFYGYDSGANDMVSQKQQLLDNQAKIDDIQDKKIKELEEGGGSGSTKPTLIETTYSELKSLRDNSQLTPGCWYRITDYITTVNPFLEPQARSAEHKFDILVLATSVNTLSEEAKVIQNEGEKSEISKVIIKMEVQIPGEDEKITQIFTSVRDKVHDMIYQNEQYYAYAFLFDTANTYFYTKSLTETPNIDEIYMFNIQDEPILVSFSDYLTEIISQLIPGATIELSIINVEYGYFTNSNLNAWKVNYTPNNIKWSQQAGTYVYDEDNDYTFFVIGNITLQGHTYKLLQGFGMYIEDWSNYALMESVEEGEPIYAYYGNPEEFDPESLDEVGTASRVSIVSEEGKGTITYMKDEFNNECSYDFKNIQFKRYMTTDSVSEREGLNGLYMVAEPHRCAQNLSVEDLDDFIWAYTFSSDNSGGEQEDYSLTSEYNVHNNIMKPYSGGLPNNVMFGDNNYGNSFGVDCNNNSWGNYCRRNSWGSNCYDNSLGNNFYDNSWGSFCQNNSWGSNCYDNSLGSSCQNNSLGSYCSYNSLGNNCSINSLGNSCESNYLGNKCYSNSLGSSCQSNSLGISCQSNSLGSYCSYNSLGNYCNINSWSNNITNSTVFNGVQYTQITTENVKNVQVLNGVAGRSSSKLTLTFDANKTYTQVAALNSSGQLKIYVPGDLVQ